MVLTEDQARGLEFIRRMNVGMEEILRRSVVPVYGYAPELQETRLIGSGTLFRVADQSFLVTAAHVLEDMHRRYPDDGFGTADLWGAKKALSIQGRTFYDPASENDVGLVELSEETVERLSAFEFLRLSAVDLDPSQPPDGLHYLMGYPIELSSRSRGAYTTDPFVHSTTLLRPEPGRFTNYNYDLQRHLLMEIDRNEAVNGVGEPANVPRSFEGMSGCPVWRAHIKGDDPRAWTLANARMVGVQTAVLIPPGPATIVKATRWTVVAGLICKAYPDLCRALDVHAKDLLRLVGP
jgi:hypothetical protein